MNFQQIDHLLFGGPDLDQATDQISTLSGSQPVVGGSHPGKGTRNSLLSLSHGVYFEIIGPDPAQQVDKTWMDLDRMEAPSLFRWAARCNDLEGLRAKGLSAGIDIGEIQSGSRRKTDGTLLSWRLSNPDIVLGDGLVPFFIDWGPAGNPASSLPTMGEIEAFYATHPDPEPVQHILKVLGINLEVNRGPVTGLHLQVTGPQGTFQL